MSPQIISVWGSAPYAAALFSFLVAYFVIYPFVYYIRDPKGVLSFSNSQPVKTYFPLISN